jgi:hypothetical protein
MPTKTKGVTKKWEGREAYMNKRLKRKWAKRASKKWKSSRRKAPASVFCVPFFCAKKNPADRTPQTIGDSKKPILIGGKLEGMVWWRRINKVALKGYIHKIAKKKMIVWRRLKHTDSKKIVAEGEKRKLTGGGRKTKSLWEQHLEEMAAAEGAQEKEEKWVGGKRREEEGRGRKRMREEEGIGGKRRKRRKGEGSDRNLSNNREVQESHLIKIAGKAFFGGTRLGEGNEAE